MPRQQLRKSIHPAPPANMTEDIASQLYNRLPESDNRCSRLYRAFRSSFVDLVAAVLSRQPLRQTLLTIVCLAIFGFRVFHPALVWLSLASVAVFGASGWFFFGEASDPSSQDFGRYRPRIFLCWTTHMRFKPFSCRFRYPILYVGFPASARGNITGGRMFSILPHDTEDSHGDKRFTFFTVDPNRYFNGSLPFDRKLHEYLISQGRDPAEFPHTYVVTTPAFFKVAFNPVSYYYLYNASHELAATILEVNNTFHQSHMYTLNPSDIVPLRRGYTFSSRIQKHLHISPFNKPTGYYDMQVLDPLTEPSTVDINMSVFNDEGIKVMVARATSRGSEPWDMQHGSRAGGAWIAAVWGINSMTALPLTFMEAGKIWWKGAAMHDDVEGRVSQFKGGKLM